MMPEKLETIIKLTDLTDHLREEIEAARTESGWDAEKLQQIVQRTWAAGLGPHLTAEVMEWGVGEGTIEVLSVTLEVPEGRAADGGRETFSRANELANEGNLQGALTLFRDLVHLYPENAEYHACVGQALEELGSAEEAESSLITALAVNPGNHRAMVALANLYTRSERPALARPILDRASELYPDDVYVLASLGATRGKLGDHAGAADAFERALAIDPNNMGVKQALRTIRESGVQ